MGQITSATIKMIRDHIARGEHPPLTVHEIDQLAAAWERSQPAATPAGSPAIAAGFGTLSPDDRFYHAADRTWWRRGDDGMLVRADAPQSAAGAEPCKDMVPVRREAVDWLKKHYPALCEKSGLCERVAGRLYTRTSLAASAAPVAQEPPQVTDVEIEKIVTELGARWDGSIWKVEDADLHPMARALLYRDTAAPVAAQAQSVVNQPLTTNSGQDDETLADTQRAIIEAAERRGYARAKSECGQDREDAKAQIVAEYNRWTRAHASGQSYDDFLKLESAARAAKEQP